jgi:alpha-N-arabinofuranosidase
MNRIVIDAGPGRHTISRHLYGHFAEHLGRCIYGGIWVGEDSPIPNTRGIRNDVVEALRALEIPNLRWPGGCFADDYHWMDGIGPRGDRPSMINTHWGGLTENNHFGTHEFMDLCEQLDCEPYISGNLGSGTVQEMQQWVEYLTFDGRSPMADLRRENGRDEPWRVKYWGVGNENWGCGGSMRPEYYADEYRRFNTYLRNFGDEPLYRIACGANATGADSGSWTEVMMERTRQGSRFPMDGLALHYYTHGPKRNLPATGFGEDAWYGVLHDALRMDAHLREHLAIMDRHDPDGGVDMVVDEWGASYAVEPGTNPRFLYQQNSLRDALVATLTFDIFNRYCHRISMANIAQAINVLQAMILTEEGGERIVLTPSYHAFEMYRVHHDATLLPLHLERETLAHGDMELPAVSATASRDGQGRVHLTLTNTDANREQEVSCSLRGMSASGVSGRLLTGDSVDAHNTFDDPERVRPVAFGGASLQQDTLTVLLPPRSVVALALS